MPAATPSANIPVALAPETNSSIDAQQRFESHAVRVIVFNDHPVFRSALIWKIGEGSGVQVITDAASLVDTLSIADEESQYGLHAVVADLRIGDGNAEGMASVAELVNGLPNIPVVVSSDLYSRSFAERLTAAGAAAVVQKSAGVETVVSAILEAVADTRSEALRIGGQAA